MQIIKQCIVIIILKHVLVVVCVSVDQVGLLSLRRPVIGTYSGGPVHIPCTGKVIPPLKIRKYRCTGTSIKVLATVILQAYRTNLVFLIILTKLTTLITRKNLSTAPPFPLLPPPAGQLIPRAMISLKYRLYCNILLLIIIQYRYNTDIN